MRRLFIVLSLLVGIAAALWLAREPLGEMAYDHAVKSGYGSDATADLGDGIHVILCGTGSPLPDPDRSGPCTLVIAGKKVFLVDAGSGAGRRIWQIGVPLGRIDATFLTHFHSDHIDGLGEVLMLRWAAGGRRVPMPVFGPQGVGQVVSGFDTAYTADYGYRIAHHGADIMPRSGAGARAQSITLAAETASALVYSGSGVRITAFRVDHNPVEPALGYRFDYKGRSIVISGDTAPTPAVSRMCGGCDVLVHEVLNSEMVGKISATAMAQGDNRIAKIMSDIPGYHTGPVAAARLAQKGKARLLVFTHIVPRIPTRLLHPYFLHGVAGVYTGKVVMGEDGMLISLPAGSDAIEQAGLL